MSALLEVRALAKRFGPVVTADAVSFDLPAGGALGIVGPNGAGKSTLLSMITGALRADGGRIVFDGHDVTGLPVAARTGLGIARTFQIPRPFVDMTVFENVLAGAAFGAGLRGEGGPPAAPPPPAPPPGGPRAPPPAGHQGGGGGGGGGGAPPRGRPPSALERTGLLRLANQPAGKLRLLDRKRLELARALATGPRLLLLDEIAGGLTDHELPPLVDLVRTLHHSGVTVIWIEHIVHALTSVVDELLCLAGGHVLAHGSPHEVMRNPDVVDVYLGTTFDAEEVAS